MKSSIAPSKSVRRAASFQKIKVARAVPIVKERAEKAVKSTSWANIFDISKARISFSPRDLEFNEVRIRSTTPVFASTFGFDSELLNAEEDSFRPISVLFGKATNREFPFLIENTLLAGQTVMEYVNFYRTDGEVLSCHVTIRSVPSGDQARQEMQESTGSDERWAVLTVRSASAIGNANFIGVGLLGVDRISQTQLELAIGGEASDLLDLEPFHISSNVSGSDY